jgi:hypothetical protein
MNKENKVPANKENDLKEVPANKENNLNVVPVSKENEVPAKKRRLSLSLLGLAYSSLKQETRMIPLRPSRLCYREYYAICVEKMLITPTFFPKGDPEFHTLHTTIDNLFKCLCADGIGASLAHTESISKEEESQLWSSGVLNVDNPKGLLRSVFYLNGKYFCLRGGDEHRLLGMSQLQRLHNPERYVYFENASRTGKVEFCNLD